MSSFAERTVKRRGHMHRLALNTSEQWCRAVRQRRFWWWQWFGAHTVGICISFIVCSSLARTRSPCASRPPTWQWRSWCGTHWRMCAWGGGAAAAGSRSPLIGRQVPGGSVQRAVKQALIGDGGSSNSRSGGSRDGSRDGQEDGHGHGVGSG